MKILQKMSCNQMSLLLLIFGQWCGPCRMLSPILEEVATETGAKVKILKLNIDENSENACCIRRAEHSDISLI